MKFNWRPNDSECDEPPNTNIPHINSGHIVTLLEEVTSEIRLGPFARVIHYKKKSSHFEIWLT